jgi:hypothetical protein
MSQPSLFNSTASEEARIAGMAQAADNKAGLLRYARKLAVEIAKEKGVVSADDVQEALAAKNISVHALGNAAGSLFVDRKVWEWTGQFIKSKRAHSHSNLIRTWRLK